MIFVPCTVNPCEITVHAQEKKERKKEEKKVLQDSTENAESKWSRSVVLI